MLFNKEGIGLDIGSKKIKLVRVKKKQEIGILQYGEMMTPSGSVEGGIIHDPQRLGEEMAGLVREMKLNGKPTVSAVTGQQVYNRNIIMPTMPLSELKEAVQFQAMSFLPIPVEEASMDVFPLRNFEDEEGKKTEVFFAAVRKQQVEALDLASKVAGLNLVAVEIEPMAVYRVLGPLIEQDVKAFLNIGGARSYFTVFREDIMVYYRSLAFGISAFYESHNEHRSIFSQAKDDFDQHNTNDDYFVRKMMPEMARSVEYYDIQNRGNEIIIIYLLGGGSLLDQLAVSLTEGLGREVVVADSLARVRIPRDISEVDYRMLKYDFIVAIGLAARDLG